MASESDFTLRDKLIQSLKLQNNELELLKSMYPEDGEIILCDKNILEKIDNFVLGSVEFVPEYLNLIVNLKVEAMKIEINITLPSFYPLSEEPDIYVRCNQLNRVQETQLNNDVSSFITSQFEMEPCIYTVVLWIQDNIENYTSLISPTPIQSNKTDPNPCNETNEEFSRYWIYSHHIYNKQKRDEIQTKAKELNLTGFCLPGKPGIICVEGPRKSCEDWWKHIKSLSWQKIILKTTETFPISEVGLNQKFCNFQEIHFKNNVSKNSRLANMSEFSKFLETHNLGYIFNEFFGFNK